MPQHSKDVIILLALYREVGVSQEEEQNQQQLGSKVNFLNSGLWIIAKVKCLQPFIAVIDIIILFSLPLIFISEKLESSSEVLFRLFL